MHQDQGWWNILSKAKQWEEIRKYRQRTGSLQMQSPPHITRGIMSYESMHCFPQEYTFKLFWLPIVVWNNISVAAWATTEEKSVTWPLFPPPLYHLPVLQAYILYTAHSLRTGAAVGAITPVSKLKATGHWSSAASEHYFCLKAQDILTEENAMSHLQDYYFSLVS